MMLIQNNPDPSEYNNFLTDIAHEKLKSSITGEVGVARLSKIADATGSVKAFNDVCKPSTRGQLLHLSMLMGKRPVGYSPLQIVDL